MLTTHTKLCWQSLFLVAAMLLLSACGDSSTRITEREPVPVEDDHDHDHDDDDHDHDHDEAPHPGRLLISAKDLAQVNVLDLEEGTVLAQYPTTGVPNAVYASAQNRYAFVVQRNEDRVDLIDGGLWQEDHGDHLHDYNEAPQFMSFFTTSSRPTHFTGTEAHSVIFYDGNSATATPARVGVFSEADIADNSSGAWLDYSTHMHGAAQGRGDYLISTLRDPLSTSTLPDEVALYHRHDDHFDQELVFTEQCPGLHGSAQNHEFIAFGCTDGVLVIEQDGDNFSAAKIANPGSFTGSQRIGTLVGDSHLDIFVGIASGAFFAVDPETGAITPIDWQDEGATAIGYGFADHGELFVILDNQGRVTVLDVAQDWQLLAKIQAISSNIAALPAGSRFELAFSRQTHHVFVSDPIANQIKLVDLEAEQVIQSIQLDFIPHKLTWLGVAEPAEGDHQH